MTQQQTQARNRTARQIEALNREILQTYDDALKAVTRDLEKVYARVLSGVAPEDMYNVMIQRGRLEGLQREIAKTYSAFSAKAGVQVRQASSLGMSNNYYQQQFVMDFFSPNARIALNFAPLPPSLAEASVNGTLSRWNDLTVRQRTAIGNKYGAITGYLRNDGSLTPVLLQNRRQELLRLNRAISSSLIRGESFAQTVRSVKGIIDMSKNSTTRIVRTEGNRTLNAGAYANTQQLESQGVPIERAWLATLDDRIRPDHISLDGVKVGVNEPFEIGGDSAMYPGGFSSPEQSINCRCTTIDVVDGIAPTARRGINPVTGESEIFNWSTYPDWARANGLTESPSGRWA